ncbi:Uncharacterized protein CG5902,AMME syndrome candidate gene 1 protein,Uncharacterized protein R166.3,AMME syndrome candidate gene 1 protein homolog,AMMECR1-like protein,Uncharacterized protein At2g38710 [Lepeophtheirus salmonis]|uniref:Uncharacterized protein n=2 Tax=Lepeophtheirus salmonis TaxID=72036 RepID=A0A7R8CL27_LEPSM|nr:Uncharacterized protein CG5902,AMME syndrome candidate gene 1 protein,Uncharacterized protein R166.3,AMME syndrome candidate gene 1 protein homolog,AMMECR1-like protein,Uncharacterized protein At2g38710 [Lepeophtheirus salmonis]CAF2851021.1 Uncharacterized protein CG5902,AMME syndrome candidate gene 1 protein,Uncharacterized protein R166.3,AMME syndrome candidate gene 1 protein homolog,AMMECR1-like protein,Uncharacterized protein At2g38710 [Lepeophtheirus salmonis]
MTLDIARNEMPVFCFDVLSSKLNGDKSPPKEPNFSNDSYPLFVTWTKGENRKLRGCIGTFSKLKLRKGIREYTLISGLEDHRFGSILPEEIPHLQVCVSILYQFEDGLNYLDWEIGVNGIKIEFRDESGTERLATYLPEVPRLNEWDKIKTIDKLLKKGGWKSEITPELRNSIKLVRYRSNRATMDYSEYISHCKQRKEGTHKLT